MQRVFDLTAAAALLCANPKAEPFIKAVRKFQSAISVSTDLADVKKSVEELQKMREDVGAGGHIAKALLIHAVPYVKNKEVDRAKEIDEELAKAPELFKLIDRVPFNVEEFYKDVPGGIENFWGPMGFVVDRTVKSTAKIQAPGRDKPERGN